MVHPLDRLQQKLHVGKGFAAGAFPMHPAIDVDENGGVQIQFLEVIEGGEPSGVRVVGVGQEREIKSARPGCVSGTRC